jgi:parallel beta-helix repeat protein
MFHNSPAPRSRTISVLAFIAFCCSAVCHSSTVQIHPGQNIPQIVADNPAGTTFVIYPGLYRLTAHIVPKNGDIFMGQTACAPPNSSCPAILSGARAIGSLAKFNGTNYEVTNQTQQGPVYQPSKVCQAGYLACNLPEDLFFDNVPYKHLSASSLPAIGHGQWWFDYAHNIIYFHDSPSGHTVETSVLDTAFMSTANNVTIQYLTIKDFASPLQRAGVQPSNGTPIPTASANWTIRNCEIYNNHGAGVRVAYGIGVYNNYIHDNGIVGIIGGTQSSTPSKIIVQGNTINHNNYAKALSAWGAGGFKVGQTSGVVIRGNTVSNNDGAGIHFDTSSSNALIDGNTVARNLGGGGIAYEVSLSSVVIRNNYLLQNALPDGTPISTAGIGSYDSTAVSMYCNVVEVPNIGNNSGAANAIQVNASNRGYNIISPFQYLTTTQNTFHHNTVIWDAGANGIVGYHQGDVTNQPDFFSHNAPPDYNTYHLPSLSDANFNYDNNNTGLNQRKAFSEYQAAGADIHGEADTKYNSGYPTVKITAPLDQTSFSNSTTIQATASDKSGINRVEFYVDWTLKSTVAGPPYNFAWRTTSIGTHTVAAVAYSNAGIRNCYAVTLTDK